ncbi:hypothetical protein AJ80_06346 [Polytolypa hystricis UAMH7299]|uniref:Uncharacterized protein n=1 Tax=Polytolypa hystricis (strain UAMH7299) TaxID=1447883 RepID=A0A2B7XXK1_POLH7|nr:hypothetical protein AJ80_06346 [Polytolypa hystricis UAMH7299]
MWKPQGWSSSARNSDEIYMRIQLIDRQTAAVPSSPVLPTIVPPVQMLTMPPRQPAGLAGAQTSQSHSQVPYPARFPESKRHH